MTKEYASPGVLTRVAQQRHGHPMGTVRPPLVPDADDARPLQIEADVLAAAGQPYGVEVDVVDQEAARARGV